MAFSTGGGHGRPNADINVTPLVDVVLVLLIIFMVVTPLLQVSLDADIPKPEQDTTIEQPQDLDQIVISIHADGSLWMNKDAVTEESLASRLGEIMRKKADKVAFLNGTDNLEFGRVIHVMDICRGAGVKRVGIIDPIQ